MIRETRCGVRSVGVSDWLHREKDTGDGPATGTFTLHNARGPPSATVVALQIRPLTFTVFLPFTFTASCNYVSQHLLQQFEDHDITISQLIPRCSPILLHQTQSLSQEIACGTSKHLLAQGTVL